MGFSAATEHEMEAFFSILQDVEPDVTQEDRANECLNKRPKLKEFLQHCCHERKYVFGVKKCGKSDCTICQPPCLPESVFYQLHHIPDPIPENEQHYTGAYAGFLKGGLYITTMRAKRARIL
jgi:hypothetical protein